MNKIIRIIHTCLFLTFCLAGTFTLVAPANAVDVNFIGRLANFDGILPSLWSRIALDKERTEAFILSPRQRDIRIFNETGMEIFEFGDDVELAGATDLDIGEEGNIYLVFPRVKTHKLVRLDYKGEPLEFFDLKQFPDEFLPFKPDRMQYKDGSLYLADTGSMDVVITDINGVFKKGYHLKAALQALEDEFKGRPGEESMTDPERFKFLDMTGFCVDQDGSIYFTISVLFSAFKYSEGKLEMFGDAGSGPGKFGVVAGIDTDKYGNIYVSDRLRSVVMIFDPAFKFQKEFGYRGTRPGSLIVPDDVTVDDEKGMIYVAQAANRGVSVYRLVHWQNVETDSETMKVGGEPLSSKL